MEKQSKLRKIRLYPPSNTIHNFYKVLLTNPPENYKFEKIDQEKKLMFYLKEWSFLKKLYKIFIKITKKDLYNKIMFTPPKGDFDILFSMGVLYFGNKPWVLDILDHPISLTGYNYNLFIKNKEDIEKKLLDKNCKAIICENQEILKIMKKYFSKKVLNKIYFLNPAIKQNDFKKRNKENFQILFMGSISNSEDFLIKGGLDVLRIFTQLIKKYPNLKLLVKCKVPEKIKKQYFHKNIKFIEEIISYEEIQKIYSSSDILLMPGHTYFLMAFLESMSYGVPIVALDTYAVKDYVIDKKTGFLIKPSKNFPYDDPFYPANVRNKEFIDAIFKGDEKVVNDLASKVELLIKNPEFKQKLSQNTRKQFKTKFSISKRNKVLKKILDKI
jgi:glycosyltransferase involved in cell wall biosynthesis